MSDHHYEAEVIRLGIPDKFIEHGSPKELYHECHFDADDIESTVRELVKSSITV
jgi:1-deoxy-D-xylulose-5-phosphate synthase